MKEREYFAINEESARRAKEMSSFYDYTSGSTTQAYKAGADEVYDLAEKVYEKRGEEQGARAWALAVRYARGLAKYYNEDNRIGCKCPSVMIAGSANFPVKKKQKQVQAWDRNHEFYNSLKSYVKKIENILYAREVIKSNDEHAEELLEEKIANLTEDQERMKRVNAYYRKNGTLDGCEELSWETIQRLKSSMASHAWERRPYPTFELSTNRQNLKRYEERLANLRNKKNKGNSEEDHEWYKVVENVEMMRFQFIFEDKPSRTVREIMKSNGYRWAPSVEAWQRQLTENAQYSAKRVMEALASVPEEERWDR